ncbi:MAG: cation:proton antiporter, partial [Myxococcota bacterium]
MDILDISASLLCLAAVFAWLNQRFLKLPATIGLMAIALLFSLGIVAIGSVVPSIQDSATAWLSQVDFSEALMDGMLGVLLFAGALHVDLEDLAEQKLLIGVLASLGVLASTFMVGGFIYGVLTLIGFEVRFIMCLLFGALISPTDPIAVLG